MKLEYDSGGLIGHVFGWLMSVIIAVVCFIGGLALIESIGIILFIIGGIIIICSLFYPAVVFWSLGDDEVKELKEYNKDKKDKDRIKIPHPKRQNIAILTIIGFFTGGIGHLIALVIGCGQGLVEISESQRKLLGLTDGNNPREHKKSLAVVGVDVAAVSETGNQIIDPPLLDQGKQKGIELEDNIKNLRELKSLLDDGVIDQETYDKKKDEIGF